MNECVLFDGPMSDQGYGRVYGYGSGKYKLAHRLAWETVNGPVPEGLELDHLCRVPRCINVEHLEAVPHRINTLRGVGPTAVNARKSECPAGHSLAGRNVLRDKRGRRKCRTCQRRQEVEYQRRSGKWRKKAALEGE